MDVECDVPVVMSTKKIEGLWHQGLFTTETNAILYESNAVFVSSCCSNVHEQDCCSINDNYKIIMYIKSAVLSSYKLRPQHPHRH